MFLAGFVLDNSLQPPNATVGITWLKTFSKIAGINQRSLCFGSHSDGSTVNQSTPFAAFFCADEEDHRWTCIIWRNWADLIGSRNKRLRKMKTSQESQEHNARNSETPTTNNRKYKLAVENYGRVKNWLKYSWISVQPTTVAEENYYY